MADPKKRIWTTSKGEVRQAWVVAFTDANGKRHKEQFATKREADARYTEVKGQVTGGTYRPDAKTKTVKDACKAYLSSLEVRKDQKRRVSQTYFDTTKGEIWNYIARGLRDAEHDLSASRVTPFNDDIGHFKLSQFSAPDVDDWAERLIAAGVSVSTTRRLIKTLARALKYAIRKKMVAINVAEDISVIGTREDDSPKKVIPPKKFELDILIKNAPLAMKTKVLFASASGLRASEQWALTWRDLWHKEKDPKSGKELITPLQDANKAGFVTVSKRIDVHLNEDTTKTEAGKRDVPLGKKTVAALLQWRRQTNRSADDDLVFPNTEGGYIRHGNFLKREFDPFKIDKDLPALTWHALRHFAISTWIEAGLKPKAISTFAGHSTLAITMDRYGHLFPSDDHTDAMDKIAESLPW